MTKRKVLIVAHHLTVGGSQKSLIAALKAIDYEKNDVTLYVRKNRLDLLDQVDDRVTVIVNEDPTHYYRHPKAIYYLLRISVSKLLGKTEKCKQYKDRLSDINCEKMMDYEMSHYFKDAHYDVAIVYIQGYTADIVAKRINADRKYVFYHISTDEAHEFHEEIFKSFDKIIAVSKLVQNELQNNLYPQFANKVAVIDNYVDYDRVISMAKEGDIDFDSSVFNICSCGRFTDVKGFDIAVEAARRLKEKGMTFKWYFVGDGPMREDIEALIDKYSLKDNIVITGMTDNPYKYMAGCDIYVQPSYEDAQPLTVIEARMLCRPIVATRTMGATEQVKDRENGLLCDIDGNSLGDGVFDVLEDKKAYEKMVSNLKAVDFSKDFEIYCKRWEDLLDGNLK